MLSKKLLVGAAIMALTIGTGAVAYASSPQNEGVQFLDEISIQGEGALSFDEIDKDNLPEGVFYQDEISMEATGGISLE